MLTYPTIVAAPEAALTETPLPSNVSIDHEPLAPTVEPAVTADPEEDRRAYLAAMYALGATSSKLAIENRQTTKPARSWEFARYNRGIVLSRVIERGNP